MRLGVKGIIQTAITICGYTESDEEDATFHGILTSACVLTDGTNDVKIDIYNTGALSDKSAAKMIFSAEVKADQLSAFFNFQHPLFIDASVASPGYSVEITSSGGAGCGFIINGSNMTIVSGQ